MADTPAHREVSRPTEASAEIDRIIAREGPPSNDPTDQGGQTAFGISQNANPGVSVPKLSREEARLIYWTKYVKGPGFDRITDLALQEQVVDFGVTSGPATGTMFLQRALGVEQDGVCGPKTLTALALADLPALRNRLAILRACELIAPLVQKRPSDLKYLRGWLRRVLGFVRP